MRASDSGGVGMPMLCERRHTVVSCMRVFAVVVAEQEAVAGQCVSSPMRGARPVSVGI